MQCVKEHGKMEQVVMGGGLIYTQSKSAKHEFEGMNGIMVRGRMILGRWIEVTRLVARVRHGDKDFDPIAQGGLVDPKEMSWHRVRGSMNDNAAAGTAALITAAVTTAAVEFYGQEVWDTFSAKEQLEKSSSYEFTCWNHNRNLIIEWGLKGMNAWLTEKLADSKAEIRATPSLAWVRSDVDNVEGPASAVWK